MQESIEKHVIKPVIIDKSCVVFYYPDSLVSDSLKKQFGDKYFKITDSLTSNNQNIRVLADSFEIGQIATEASILVFKVADGVETTINTHLRKNHTGVIIFKKGEYPVVVSPEIYRNQILKLFNPKDEAVIKMPDKHKREKPKTSKTGRIKSKPVDEPVVELIVPSRKPDSLGWMQRKLSGFLDFFSISEKAGTSAVPGKFNNYSVVSQKSMLSVCLENDIFFGTDIWYSNGVNISYYNPIWQASPFSVILLPYKKKSINFYSLSLEQNMYTPKYPTWEGIQYDDRPFSSFLTLTHHKMTNSPDLRLRINSSFAMGVIGAYALGGEIQSYLHGAEKRPVGWNNQIANDLVLNYNVILQKSVFFNNHNDLSIAPEIMAGTLFTNASAGVQYRWSKYSNFYSDPFPVKKTTDQWKDILHKVQYSFFAKTAVTGVLYDATLQGGVFNKTSLYTISNERMNRLVMNTSVGFEMSYKQFSLDFSAFMLSPEFDPQKRWHKWGRINFSVAL